MFIFVAYKDLPELSNFRQRMSETDLAVEKTLLVNPNCPVRVMLEFIRKKCRLGIFTQFDLCDDSGNLKGLFNMPTYAYATEQFEHKRTYYLIVLKMTPGGQYGALRVSLDCLDRSIREGTGNSEHDKRISVLPQLNRENKTYEELKNKVKNFMMMDSSPIRSPPPAASLSGKSTPIVKVASKKK